MPNESFVKLIEESKEWVKLSKSRGYDFDSILAGVHNDPSHFIYEMLQNAEDEEAKEVRFELFEDRLDIYHDGKTFDFEDIKVKYIKYLAHGNEGSDWNSISEIKLNYINIDIPCKTDTLYLPGDTKYTY